MEILNQTVASSISKSKQISECDVAEWEEMKQMTLIEMDGFLKGKCIPSDLKVNETNAEYLVRKFGELESKLETALRECRSAGITIDNLEAKCAKMAAENTSLKQSEKEFNDFCREEFSEWEDDVTETAATDAFLAEIRAEARNEGINYTASRLAAAFNHGLRRMELRGHLNEIYDGVIVNKKEGNAA